MKATGFDRCLQSVRLWLMSALAFLALTAGVFASSEPPRWAGDFIGLWQGVDGLDGSMIHVSLSDVDGDGVLELTQREGFYTSCFRLGPGFSQGRGFITGTGIVRAKGVLDLHTSFFCVDDNNVVTLVIEENVRYRLRSNGQILLLPQFGDLPRNSVHRTSW